MRLSDYVFTAPIENCKRYDSKNWVDSNGKMETLQIVNGHSIQDCMHFLCYDNPECVAFTYNTIHKQCNLKSSTQAVRLKSFGNGKDDGITAVKSPKSCKQPGKLAIL